MVLHYSGLAVRVMSAETSEIRDASSPLEFEWHTIVSTEAQQVWEKDRMLLAILS